MTMTNDPVDGRAVGAVGAVVLVGTGADVGAGVAVGAVVAEAQADRMTARIDTNEIRDDLRILSDISFLLLV